MKNKIYNFIISILFISFTFSINESFAQSGWYQVTSPQTGYSLWGIYFSNINTGVCSKFKTTNGGISWYQTISTGNYAMQFPNANTGYRVGAGITKTTNQGENWISQSNPASNLDAVSFVDVNVGYASGDGGYILKTTNGGNNWNILTSPVSNLYYLDGCCFTDANNGYICGYLTSDFSSVILKTSNGGLNWNVQNFGTSTGYSAIFFINNSTGIAVGEKIVKTTDAGLTWVLKTEPVGMFCQGLYFSSSSIGYGSSMGGIIIKTTNGGESWFRQNTPISSDFNSVYFINDNTGFVCSNNGEVLKTTDGGGPPVGINPISNIVPESFYLYQNYPNPFNPATKLKFDIPKNQMNVKIRIYNSIGELLFILIDSPMNAGINEINFEAKNLSSGVYFYQLVSEDYSVTKKMLLVK